MKTVASVLIILSAIAASAPARAQDGGCVTTPAQNANAAPRTCGPAGGGQIVSAEQPVSVIRQASVLRLGAGSALMAGDRILVRGANTATISLGGSCAITVASGATTTLVGAGGRLCVTQQAPAPAAPPSNVSAPVGPGPGPGVPVYVGAGVIGAGAIAGALLLNQDDKRRAISQPAVNN